MALCARVRWATRANAGRFRRSGRQTRQLPLEGERPPSLSSPLTASSPHAGRRHPSVKTSQALSGRALWERAPYVSQGGDENEGSYLSTVLLLDQARGLSVNPGDVMLYPGKLALWMMLQTSPSQPESCSSTRMFAIDRLRTSGVAEQGPQPRVVEVTGQVTQEVP